MKNKLLLSTAIIGSLASYYKRSYAACVSVSGDGNYLCSGESTGTQLITSATSTTTTSSGFSVNSSSGGAGISISGTGDLSFTDRHESHITSSANFALEIQNDNFGGSGSINLYSNSKLSAQGAGVGAGLFVSQYSAGATDIEFNGDVLNAYMGVLMVLLSQDNNSLKIGKNANINATSAGIFLLNAGTSDANNVNVEVNGNITSANNNALTILTQNQTHSTTINIGQDANLHSSGKGIYFSSSSEINTISVSGDITSPTQDAIHIKRATNGIDITIQNGSTILANRVIGSPDASDVEFNLTLDGSVNAVSITGTSGTAIEFGNQDDNISISGNVTIDGNIDTAGGSDNLTLNNANLTLASNSTFNNIESASITGTNIVNGNLDLRGLNISSSANSSLTITGDIMADSLIIGSGSNLSSNGEISGNVLASSGSTLSGNSQIGGNLVATSGSTISPGNSIGTINVNGNVTFETGSNFDVEIDGNNADKIIATGTINIESGVNLNVTALGNHSGSATILESGAGIVGQFDNIVTNNGSVVSLVYIDDNVNASLTSSGAASLSFITTNTSTFAAQVQSSVNNSILFSDVLTRQISNNAFEKEKNFWVKGINRTRNANHSKSDNFGFNSKAYGIAFGAEAHFSDEIKLGFALSQITDDLSIERNQGSRKSQSSFGSIYGIYGKNLSNCENTKLFTSLSLGLGYHEGQNKRLVNNGGNTAYANSKVDDADLALTLQGGIKFKLSKLKNNFYAMPIVSASYIKTYAGDFKEDGGGNSSIVSNEYDFSTTKFREAIRFGSDFFKSFGGLKLSPYLELGLSQERAISNRSFSGEFSTGDRFNATLNKLNSNFFTATFATKAQITEDLSGFISYEGSKSKQETRDDFRVGIEMKF